MWKKVFRRKELHWRKPDCGVCSVVSDSATPWTAARLAPLSMGFSWQEHWSGLPCPPPGNLPDPGMEPESPALAGGFLSLSRMASPLSTVGENKIQRWRKEENNVEHLQTCRSSCLKANNSTPTTPSYISQKSPKWCCPCQLESGFLLLAVESKLCMNHTASPDLYTEMQRKRWQSPWKRVRVLC